MLRPTPRHDQPLPMIHLHGCTCADCTPPFSHARAAIETAGYLAFGMASAWIVDRLLDGPGIQIMWGM